MPAETRLARHLPWLVLVLIGPNLLGAAGPLSAQEADRRSGQIVGRALEEGTFQPVAAVEIYRGASDAAGSRAVDAGAGPPGGVGRCGFIYVWIWKGRNPYQNLDWDDWEEISCPLSGVNRTGC